MRDGLIQLVAAQPDLVLGGQAADPAEAFPLLKTFRPDLILTDISMPGRGGLEFIKDLLAQDPRLRILVVSAHDECVYAERALQAGARGYIMKDEGAENLLNAIRQVLRGEIYVAPQIATALLERVSTGHRRPSQSPIEKLTDREFEIFQMVGQGRSTRAIAEQLHLSPKTVEAHRASLRLKLDLPDGTALVRHAIRWVETES